VIQPLSGPLSRIGEQFKAAQEAAMQAISEDDLLKHGYTLQWEYIDDMGTVAGAPTAANLALDQYGCHVAIAHTQTIQCLASMPFFEERKVPSIGLVSGPAIVSSGFEYFNMATACDLVQVDTMLEYLINVRGFNRLGLIHINTEGGMSAANHMVEKLKKYNLSVLTRDILAGTDTDFTAQVLRNKEAKVEALVFWGLPSPQIIVQQIEQLWGKIPEEVHFQGGTNMAQIGNTQMFSEEDLTGVYFIASFIPGVDEPTKRFNENYKVREPQHMDAFDLVARMYDAVYIIVHALNDMGPYNTNAEDFSEKLNASIRQVEFDGVQGHWNFKNFTNGEGLGRANVGYWEGYNQVKVYP
jgi:ABC-type branched-subunit amino acid transport system substrate-binding protein